MKKHLPSFLKDEFIDNKFRSNLDSSYHPFYGSLRRQLQNRIIRKIFQRSTDYVTARKKGSINVWFVLITGPIGSGKSSVLRFLLDNHYLPVENPIIVDMDQIREYLPESKTLMKNEPLEYGEKTQKESGCIAELLVWIGLYSNRSVILDGSMSDTAWQRKYLLEVKAKFSHIKALLLHISSPAIKIRERIAFRNSLGGRIVPSSYVEASIKKLNDWKPFQTFSKGVDLFIGLRNDEDPLNPSIYYPWFFDL